MEKEILEHENTREILGRFPRARIVEINHYKDLFCRPGQDFSAQKHSVKLILARRRNHFVYPGASVCENFGNANFYYVSSVMNCLYNCDYCYLQGMYPSANIVVFVNLEDTLTEIGCLLARFPIYLCVSYDTDLLALERVVGFAKKWAEFARAKRDLTIELRTKSADFAALRGTEPSDNLILAWTLSPQEIAERFERGAPSLGMRLAAVREAIRAGWKVRLCFDPLLDVKGWRELYKAMVEQVFSSVAPESVRDVSIGVFRIGRDYLKNMQKRRPDSELAQYPYACENGICTYKRARREEMLTFMSGQVRRFIEEKRIYAGM